MKKWSLLFLLICLLSLSGCGGGQEIESCLFVISMAVDAAADGNLTVTVKALSGTQESSAPQSTSSGPQEEENQNRGAEASEPGYVVLSATAESCLSALDLLGATTPRTVNLSQLQEIVLSRPLAESGAALTLLKQIHALFEANGNAVVVVTPDNAGDFIRRQYAMFGIRLSQYLQVLFEHFEQIGTIPSGSHLSAMISAMESGTMDAAAVYAAKNDFGATLALDGSATDRLPGHLPRTSPAENEYLGSAVFSGAVMVGTLTGDETAMLRLLRGDAITTSFVLEGAMMQVRRKTKVMTDVRQEDGKTALSAKITMRLLLAAGELDGTHQEVGEQIEKRAAALIEKLQALGSDAVGFGKKAIRNYKDVPSWEAAGWKSLYQGAKVRTLADVTIR